MKTQNIVSRKSLFVNCDAGRNTNNVTHNEQRKTHNEFRMSSRKTNNEKRKTIFKEFFFSFLVILLLILIYGLFQKDPGFGFLAPQWKKLDLVLGITVLWGILAVFARRS